MGVSCVCESCANHSPQISEAKISAKSRPNFDATPHKATFIVVALPPAQVPCSLSRAQGSESRTHAQYSAMPEILPLSCLPRFSFTPPPLPFSLPPNSTHQLAGLSSALSFFQMTINPKSRWSRQCNTEYSENNKEDIYTSRHRRHSVHRDIETSKESGTSRHRDV
jgi:hypothetical protein